MAKLWTESIVKYNTALPLVVTACQKMATILGAIDKAKQSVGYFDSFGAKRKQKSYKLDKSTSQT